MVVEAFAVEGYRQKKIGAHDVRVLLGFGHRWETIEFLSARGVYPTYDVEDFEQDIRTLESLEQRKPR